MTLKTNPLIHFSEYDSLPGKGAWRSTEKKTIMVEKKNNRNPFLVFSEYESGTRFENCNKNTQVKPRPVALSSRSKKNVEKPTVKHQLFTEQRQRTVHRSSIDSANKIKSKKNMRGRTKMKRKRIPKKPEPHRHSLTATETTWGVSKSSGMMSATSGSLSLETVGGYDLNATPKDLARVVSNAADNDLETEDSDEEIPVKRKKLTPAEKREKALQEERNMKKKEKELLEAEENPQSPDHFERLLIGSPNSSELWIKYIGYHAVNADIEKARAVARRGIKRIDPQLTSCKLDVWIALLNLEHTFSPPETFKETFAEAVKCNEDYAINSRVLSLYTDSKNVTEVDQLSNIMIRKYKNSVENWLQCQNALMTVGLIDKARSLLQKALSVLTKKEQVTLISRFALLENKHGFPEQAQALFENLLTSYPQRLDLLSVYVDMLIKSESIILARSVLERAASNSLPVRKMRSIYLKWIAFEEAHGKPSDVAAVEEAAKKYVSDILRPHKVEDQVSLQQDNNTIKQEDDSEQRNSSPLENDGSESDNECTFSEEEFDE